MFHAISRFRYTRLMMALSIAALVAMGTYAAAASNTFSGTPQAGGGNQAITGFTVSNIQLDLGTASPDKVVAVTFNTDVSADEVTIQTETGSGLGVARSCIDVGAGTSWSCDTSTGAPNTADVIAVHVFASRQG